jgi:ABC-type Fe3+/spermidine/putrescine transport system ATPase subunit
MGNGAPAIEVENLVIRYGAATAVDRVSFVVNQGEQLTLLGPSGCGKTSTLRAVAGLERPEAGAIRIGGQTMYDGARRINVAAEQRGLSMVFQSYAIWPHMTVFENVAYGLRVRKESGAALKERVHRALDLVQMGAFADRNASLLSGGQQQRVALARAVAFSPAVVLLDEPLSNLDAKLRAEMRIELRELQHRLKLTALYVTHDLEEALAMSDRIAVMRGGAIVQNGTPHEIYHLPRTAFVADFIGSANLVRGRLRPDLSGGGRVALETPAGHVVHGNGNGRTAGPEPVLSLRTVHLRLSAKPPENTPPENKSPENRQPEECVNVWPVVVKRSVFLGDLLQIHVAWGDRELVVRQTMMPEFTEGQTVYLAIAPEHCVLLEPE